MNTDSIRNVRPGTDLYNIRFHTWMHREYVSLLLFQDHSYDTDLPIPFNNRSISDLLTIQDEPFQDTTKVSSFETIPAYTRSTL